MERFVLICDNELGILSLILDNIALEKNNFEKTKIFIENLIFSGLIALPRDLVKISDDHLKIKILVQEKNMVSI